MYCKNPNKNPTFNRCSLQLQSLEDVMVRSDQRTQKRSLSPVFCLSEFSGHFLWSLIFFATFPAQHWNPLEVQGRLCSPWENCSFLCNPDVWFKILLYFFTLSLPWHSVTFHKDLPLSEVRTQSHFLVNWFNSESSVFCVFSAAALFTLWESQITSSDSWCCEIQSRLWTHRGLRYHV